MENVPHNALIYYFLGGFYFQIGNRKRGLHYIEEGFITKFGLKALSQSISAEGEGMIRSFTVSTGFVKTALALNQISAQAEQRGISEDEVVRDVMMGKSRTKEMMSPIEVANLFVFGFSRYARYLIGGDLLFDGGVVLTY